MKVKAKCVTTCWDSVNAFQYVPGGGPLPGGLYEIDRNGPLASLKLGSTYVFEFDRNANPNETPHDYSCKKPGCENLKPFKTLSDLGSHTRSAHKDDNVIAAEEDEEEEKIDLSHLTCQTCGRLCKSEYGLRLHNEKSHPFEDQSGETESEAETAVPA